MPHRNNELAWLQLQQLANSMAQLVWVSRPDGAPVWFNQRFQDFCGLTADDFFNEPVRHRLFHPDMAEENIRRLKEAYVLGEEWEDTFLMRSAEGEYRWFLARAVPLRDAEGALLQWFGTCTDITEQLQAREEAEAANIAKSAFISNMTHEIRTPMNAVVGLANILALSKPLSDKQHQFVTTLKTSADDLLRLIDDLLDFSRLEQKEIKLEESEFDLKRLVEETAALARIDAHEKKLPLDILYDRRLPTLYCGDARRIKQIVGHLLSNAVKFTERGGVRLRVGPGDTGRGIRIDVRDSGIGIPQEKINRIFDKFVQADGSMTRAHGGSGLGLSICRALADLMRGQLLAASAPGEGSVFTVILPLEPAAGAAQEIEVAGNGKEPGTVLLVEDYEPNILVATELLNQFGYKYDVARDAFEALEKIEQSDFSAVLMDIQMQGMDGIQATRKIRARERNLGGRRVPIIAMTAHATEDDRELCERAGMDDYLSKPFKADDFERKLRQHCA